MAPLNEFVNDLVCRERAMISEGDLVTKKDDFPYTSGGCSAIATHMRRTRINRGRFILNAAIVARPVAVTAVISVASSFHLKWSDQASR